MTETPRPVIITALPVAFRQNGQLDPDGTAKIAEKAAFSGTDGVIVLGTTGEFVTLDFAERGQVIEATLAASAGVRRIVHVGAASLYEVLRLVEQARSTGARELAVLTPHYLPVAEADMLAFYTAVADAASDCEIYAYVFRDRTGNTIDPNTMTELAALPNLVGAKISGEPLERIAEYRSAVPDDFMLYTGDDRQIARAGSFGAQGVVSGVASALPKPFTDIAALMSGDRNSMLITTAQAAVDEAVEAIRGDIARIKAVLRLEGIPAGYPRMALAEPDASEIEALRRLVERYDTLADR